MMTAEEAPVGVEAEVKRLDGNAPFAMMRKRNQHGSSLSSSSMPESETGKDCTEAALKHEKPSSTTSASTPHDASSLLMISDSGASAAHLQHSDTSRACEKEETEMSEGAVAMQIKADMLNGVPNDSAAISLRSKPRADEESVTTTTSSEIEVISTCTSFCEDSSSQHIPSLNRPFIDTTVSGNQDVLYQTLTEATELLEAREVKLMEVCRNNASLQEMNDFLNMKLEEAGLLHNFNTTDLQSSSDEFTERLAVSQTRLQHDQSLHGSVEQMSLRSKCLRLENCLKEKETQLVDLLAEGNRMAQEQLKTNNLVKSLRSKLKTIESEKQFISNNLSKAQAEIEGLRADIADLRESGSRLQDSHNQNNRRNLKLEKELALVKSELESSREKAEALNHTRLELESKLNLLTAQQTLSETRTRTEAIRDLEEEQQGLRDEVSTLRAQLEEARVSAAHQKLDAEQRLQLIRQEVNHYWEQLAESEARFETLGETAKSVAKPLLHQIQFLQVKLTEQAQASENTEQNLMAQIADIKQRLEFTVRSEHQLQQLLDAAKASADSLRKEIALERETSSQLHECLSQHDLKASSHKSHLQKLHSDLDCVRQQLHVAEETRNAASAALVQEKADTTRLRAELVQVKAELAEALQKTLPSTVTASTSPYPLEATDSRPLVETPLLTPSSKNLSPTHFSETAREVQHSYLPRLSLLPSSHFASSLSFLQSLLRQREGEVNQLRREVASLHETHERLLVALAEQTAEAERRAPSDDRSMSGEDSITGEGSLSQRYEVLLRLYGRKLEENNELRMDLREAKEAYQIQLNELLGKLNDNRRQ